MSQSETPNTEEIQPVSPGEDTQAESEQSLEHEVLSLRARLSAIEEALVRERAESENQRKRLYKEMENARKFGAERLLSDLLPVLDSLEKGLELSDADAASIEKLKEGMDMTLKLLQKATEQHGLRGINPVGEVFNPEWHQAMAMQPSSEFASGAVMKTLQKGYTLSERLVRPALVIVASES
jgi:molecular chaperone GrpE